MIIKKIKRGSKAGLKRLLDYTTAPETADGAEKCIESGALEGDFLTDDIETQKMEMIASAYQAKNSPNPAEHFVLSWRPEEQPTPQQIREAVQILTDEIGCRGHQVIYGIHIDREHVHAHAIINRAKDGEGVAPPAFLTDKQHKAIAKICDRQGWQPTPGQIYRIDERGEPVRNERPPRDHPAISHGASRAEISTGEKSAERMTQEVIPQAMKQAKNWQEFHEILKREGMSYETKGSGAVIRVHTDGKPTQPVKASTAHKQASLSNLSKRWGAYEPPPAGVNIAPRPPEAIQGADPEQVREYNHRRDNQRAQQDQARESIHTKHGEQWDALKAKQAQERAETTNGHDWTGRGHALNALRQIIAEQQRAEREALKTTQREERQGAGNSAPHQTWTEYSRGNKQTEREAVRMNETPKAQPQQQSGGNSRFVNKFAHLGTKAGAKVASVGWRGMSKAFDIKKTVNEIYEQQGGAEQGGQSHDIGGR